MKIKEKYEYDLISGKYQTRHVLHMILSLATMGWWLFVWGIVAWNNDVKRTNAEKIVYGIYKPNYIVRIIGVISTIFLILSIIGMFAIVSQEMEKNLVSSAPSTSDITYNPVTETDGHAIVTPPDIAAGE
jgi:hypothetical protein